MAQSTRRVLAVLGLCLLVVAAGCGADSGGGGDADDGGEADEVMDDGAEAGDGGDGDDAASGGSGDGEKESGGGAQSASEGASGSSAYAVETRALIRTGETTVRVESFQRARATVVEAARERGGFVGGSNQQVHSKDGGNLTWTTGTLVLRVPSENFSALVAAVNGTGEVQSLSTQTEDVTDQLVDLNARIENLRAQREQLRQIYNRTNDTQELLSIQERLSSVQSQIERLTAKRESLQRQVAYSTLTVDLREPEPEVEAERGVEPATASWYETPALAAFLESVHGVTVVLRAVVVSLAYLAPYALVFGVPLVGAAWWRRR